MPHPQEPRCQPRSAAPPAPDRHCASHRHPFPGGIIGLPTMFVHTNAGAISVGGGRLTPLRGLHRAHAAQLDR